MSESDINPDKLRKIIAGSDPRARAQALMKLGAFHDQQGEDVDAEGCYGSAADLFAQLERPFEQMHALRFLAQTLMAQGREAEAVVHYRQVVESSAEVGDTRNLGYASGALGEALSELDQIDEAFDSHSRAVAAFGEIGDNFMVGINLLAVAEIHTKRNQVKLAAEKFSLAYNHFQLAGQPLHSARAKESLAEALAILGQHQEALAQIVDASGIFQTMGEDLMQLHADYKHGQLLLESGRNTLAAEVLAEVIERARAAQLFNEAAIAELAYSVAEFRAGPEEDLSTTVMSTLSRLRAYFDAAGVGVNVLKTDRYLAEWYGRQQAWPKAIELLTHVVERCRELGEHDLERSTRARLANALIELGNHAEASAVLADIDETLWVDVEAEIEFLRQVRARLS